MGCPTSIKWFGRCFLCKSRKNLSIVTQYGYTNYHYHYHPDCLIKVLNNPEAYLKSIDIAIAIMDRINEQINSDREKTQRRRQGLERAQNTLRIISNDSISGSIDEQNRAGSPNSNNNEIPKETQNV